MATSYYCENIAPDIAAISMSGKMMMVPPTTASVVFTPSIFSTCHRPQPAWFSPHQFFHLRELDFLDVVDIYLDRYEVVAC